MLALLGISCMVSFKMPPSWHAIKEIEKTLSQSCFCHIRVRSLFKTLKYIFFKQLLLLCGVKLQRQRFIHVTNGAL